MSRHRPKILILSDQYGPGAIERLRAAGDVELAVGADESTLCRLAVDCDALLIRTGTRITQTLLDAARQLKVIGRGGVGLDNIDLEACRARGVVVVHTPGAATDAVADLAVALMINVLRGVVVGDQAVRGGRFAEARRSLTGKDVGGLSMGVVGLGRIGKAVAKRCQLGFGMRVYYNDLVEMGPLAFEAEAVSKEVLFARSDVVSLHVPLTSLTRGMIDAKALERFKPGAILLNTARGAVVDTGGLVDALETGRLGGAGLDVVDPEPIPPDHALLRLQNVVLTPHLGARTHEAQEKMDNVVDDVIRVLGGERPRFPAA